MASREEIQKKVIDVLRDTYDPEIPVNVYDLGLIYGIKVNDEGGVEIEMTLTAVGCPMARMIAYMVEENVRNKIPEVKKINVKVVWDPPWSPERITPEGREALKKIYGYDVVDEWLRKLRS